MKKLLFTSFIVLVLVFVNTASVIAETVNERMAVLEKQARDGDAQAQWELGFLHETHKEAPDFSQALKWYRLAANSGHPRAQAAIGGFYYKGKGVAKDYAEALKWLKKAEEAGSSHAALLGEIYLQGGYGIEQDKAEAFYWCSIARTKTPHQFPFVYPCVEQAKEVLSEEQIRQVDARIDVALRTFCEGIEDEKRSWFACCQAYPVPLPPR
jgi:hypothetical protein